MNVSRTILVEAPIEKVHETVSNLNTWTAWSPWLITEPEATVKVNQKGDFYEWQGKRVGEGNISITNTSSNKIDYDLTFLKPWKSKAQVDFKLKQHGDHTDVEWTMNSKLPFFMFFMKKKMEAYISMDYDRGLKLLKDYIETGEVKSKLEFLGNKNFEGCNYIGIRTKCTVDEIGTKMTQDFNSLYEYNSQNNVANGVPFSQYYDFNPVKGNVDYVAALPVSEIPENLPSNFINGKLAAAKFHTIKHTGPYEHIGNAWSAQMNMIQNKEFKPQKKYYPIEFYLNSPAEVKPEELQTEVSFALQ